MLSTTRCGRGTVQCSLPLRLRQTVPYRRRPIAVKTARGIGSSGIRSVTLTRFSRAYMTRSPPPALTSPSHISLSPHIHRPPRCVTLPSPLEFGHDRLQNPVTVLQEFGPFLHSSSRCLLIIFCCFVFSSLSLPGALIKVIHVINGIYMCVRLS